MELDLSLRVHHYSTVKPSEKTKKKGSTALDFDDDDDDDLECPALSSHPPDLRRYSPNFLSLPLSSGSSENGSSPTGKGLDVNRSPSSPAEESAPLFGGRNLKRDLEAGNDVVHGVCDEDDDNGPNSRKKLRLSKEQSAFLEESFKEHHTLNPVRTHQICSFYLFIYFLNGVFGCKQKQKLALAKHLNLRPRQVEVWFQNRRARTKLKQTEVDCEYLKRCCETLSEENRRLHKELQELRALKAASAGSPFYAPLPATTLTMCPACERVAAAGPPPRTNFFLPNQPSATSKS